MRKAKGKVYMPVGFTHFKSFLRSPSKDLGLHLVGLTSCWALWAIRKAGNHRGFFVGPVDTLKKNWFLLIRWRVDRYWVGSQTHLPHWPLVLLRISSPRLYQKIWTHMRCQGTKSSVPSGQNITESPATLLHMAVSGLLAFYFLRVTFWGKVVFENCSNVPQSYSPPWTLLWEPSPGPLCSWTHGSLFSTPSLPPWQNSFFLIAGISVFLHDANLVILPIPRNPLHPLEAGGFMGCFSFLLWCITSWSNIYITNYLYE